MHKENYFSVSRNLIIFGLATMLFSNPILYLYIGSAVVSIQNLFGASIDPQSISFNTNDPFIVGMGVVTGTGFLTVMYGMWLRRKAR